MLPEGYIKPRDYWLGENITADMNNVVDRVYRKEALSEFVENRDAIFWKKNSFPYRLKPRGGHFVPIAAAVKYKNHIWFLIVEVANFKYNWFWINEFGIYDTMSTIDNATNKTRGLIIITQT